MRNRYLTIAPSSYHKDSAGNKYPDIFTFPINNFTINEAPSKFVLTIDNIYRFDLLMVYYYGKADYDDIVLWLNGIEHISDVEAGTEILLPSKKDIESFFEEYYAV